MLISFKIYGDYRRWKLLYKLNKSMISKNNDYKLTKGMRLKYKAPLQLYHWRPKGVPYLIKKGDSLSKISLKKYSTYKRWPEIWENNRTLIRVPDLIFEGFTIYIVPETYLY